jgi:hypothetical protein
MNVFTHGNRHSRLFNHEKVVGTFGTSLSASSEYQVVQIRHLINNVCICKQKALNCYSHLYDLEIIIKTE